MTICFSERNNFFGKCPTTDGQNVHQSLDKMSNSWPISHHFSITDLKLLIEGSGFLSTFTSLRNDLPCILKLIPML